MKYTDNLNLRKPDKTDYVDIMDINYNMDILDNFIGSLLIEEGTGWGDE